MLPCSSVAANPSAETQCRQSRTEQKNTHCSHQPLRRQEPVPPADNNGGIMCSFLGSVVKKSGLIVNRGHTQDGRCSRFEHVARVPPVTRNLPVTRVTSRHLFSGKRESDSQECGDPCALASPLTVTQCAGVTGRVQCPSKTWWNPRVVRSHPSRAFSWTFFVSDS